jgi:DNA-binding CsgD family transcriptional regulator
MLATDYSWTPRQREVLDLITRGKSNQQIADTLGISLDGAKWHMREILSKLGVDTREEAAEYWRGYNGVTPRFARLLRGVVGAGLGKWLAVATAAGALVGMVAIGLTAALDGGDDPAASFAEPTSTSSPVPIPTASPTSDPTLRWQSAPPSPCPLPVQQPCDVALQVAAALTAGDVSGLFALAAPITITCPADTGSECGPVGERRQVFGSGKWGGAAGITSEDALKQFVGASLVQARPLASGEHDVGVVSVGCLADSTLSPEGRCEEFAVALRVGHEDADQVLLFAFRHTPDRKAGFYGLVNWVPWDEDLRSGEPTAATYGLGPTVYAVPKVSFAPWTPQ